MSVSYDFKGKRVLVTGGAQGLGRTTVAKFIGSGATVIALDRHAAKLQELKEEFPSVETVCVDLLDWEGSKKAVERLAPIHHLINNAGIPEAAYFEDFTPESIDRIFGINFKALVNMGQVVAKGLLEKNITSGATIVNVSSIMDNRCLRGAGLYQCTKAAVTMLTKVMALELAPQNIRVNCVRPTVMKTELLSEATEMNGKVAGSIVEYCLDRQVTKRLCTVDETVDAILYLSSEGSSMVNGSDILVDGGVYTS